MTTASKAKKGEYKGYPIRDYPFAPARHPPTPTTERFEGARANVLKRTSAEFVGVTSDGTSVPASFLLSALVFRLRRLSEPRSISCLPSRNCRGRR